MKLITFAGLGLVVLFSACSAFSGTGVTEVTPDDVSVMLDTGAVFVDVREVDEVATLAYDLPGVVNLPLSELPARAGELPRNRPVLLACRSGKRSAKAATLLRDDGFDQLYSLAGGIKAWRAAGQSVIQPGAEVMNGYPDVSIVGAMRNVMWKGELGGSIELDTITDKEGLYGLGPESYLTGELVINDGVSYRSRVNPDSSMTVTRTYDVAAPFFVYANVTGWEKVPLPATVRTIPELEAFIDGRTRNRKRPFAFKLTGGVVEASIHVQNLPAGSEVSSPEEAHQGQVGYDVREQAATIVGFFSTEHQGVFTHHDSALHMHLITADERLMGHLDAVEIGEMTLYLPTE